MVKENPVSKIEVRNLWASYGGSPTLREISLEVKECEILSIIGPANSGKTTFLRTLNRLIETDMGSFIRGDVFLEGKNIFREIEASELRKRVGMVFALPTPLPLTVFENVAYGPRRQGIRGAGLLLKMVEKSLRAAFLWEEVKDRLNTPAMKLSGGQQQRLCLARTLAVDPEVILYDEPCSGLDPISTARIEETMIELKGRYTQILVTNNTKQAARVSDRTAFFLMGELVEIGPTGEIFTDPGDQRTEDYLTGRFG